MSSLCLQIALPSQITTRTCYLDLYIQHILALQEASGKNLLKALLIQPNKELEETNS